MTPPTMLDRVEALGSRSKTYPVEGGTLKWWSSLGIGYLATPELVPYDQDYWDKYNLYRNTTIGDALTKGRVALINQVAALLPGKEALAIDVGIGNGEFVEAAGCFGTDVNEHAIAWLNKHGWYRDPLTTPSDVLTFWDVLEHIPDPTDLLASTEIILMSIPIHKNVGECLKSKHLKPGEHVWHFTDDGIKRFMALAGYLHRLSDDFETRAGREGIMTYCFSKVNINLETNLPFLGD